MERRSRECEIVGASYARVMTGRRLEELKVMKVVGVEGKNLE